MRAHMCVCMCLYVDVYKKQPFFFNSSAKWYLTMFWWNKEEKTALVPNNLTFYIPSIPKSPTTELQTSMLNPSSI